MAFVDGHSDYWKYIAKETITEGKKPNPPYNFRPITDDDIVDLQKMQISIWGKLGY